MFSYSGGVPQADDDIAGIPEAYENQPLLVSRAVINVFLTFRTGVFGGRGMD